jgi:hypothetical protein
MAWWQISFANRIRSAVLFVKMGVKMRLRQFAAKDNEEWNMRNDPNHVWTNEDIRHEVLSHIIRIAYMESDVSLQALREEALDNDLDELRKRLINIKLGMALRIFYLLDGGTAPAYWPGIMLVNSETGENLSEDWLSDFSRAEGEYIIATEPPVDEDE